MTDHSISRDSRRVPLETRVQLKFEWFGGFISEYSSNISPGGMFIRTQTPEPVGRLIGFELRLGDDFELIRGTGEVVWVRSLTQGADKPAGMGIRFLEITPEGRELIYRMVDNFIAQGGTPFDLSESPTGSHLQELPGEPEPALSEPALPEPVSPAAEIPLPPMAPLPPPAPLTPTAPVPAFPAVAATPPIAMPAADRVAPAASIGASGAAGATLAPAAIQMPQSGRLRSAPAPLVLPSPSFATEGALKPIPDFMPPSSAPPRRTISPLVLWTSVVGLALVLGALGYLKQDEVIGWFVPDKESAAVAGSTPRPRRSPLPRPAPPVAGPAAEQTPVAAATGVPAVPAAVPPAPAPAPHAPSRVVPPPAAAAATGTAPVPERVVASTGSVVSEVQKITFNRTAEGSDVVLWTDGTLRRQDWAHFHIDADPPRELIKLYGIRRPYPVARVVVGTPQVLQVRTGYHVEAKGNELHVVVDLAGFGVEVTGIEAVGAELRIHLKGK